MRVPTALEELGDEKKALHMNNTSIDRDRLRRIKYGTTATDRMNWLIEAGKFVLACRKSKKAKGASQQK